jgi:hypothetical protein
MRFPSINLGFLALVGMLFAMPVSAGAQTITKSRLFDTCFFDVPSGANMVCDSSWGCIVARRKDPVG